MSTACGLEFYFKEFKEEVGVMADLASPLVTPEAVRALKRFENMIGQLSERHTDLPCALEVVRVRTRPSDGEYENLGRKGKKISAELNSTWSVKPIGATGKKLPKPRFQLVGLASTCVSILDSSDKVLAQWHMDVSVDRSPGCYFHIQVAQARDEAPFPASLPIPRFPNVFVTPMAALDFALGELFPNRWLRRTSQSGHSQQRWRSIQKKRWEHLLRWHLECFSDTTETCSPWISFRKAQPPADLFSRRS